MQSNKHRETEKGKVLGTTPTADSTPASDSKANPETTPKENDAVQSTEQKPAENIKDNTDTKEEPKSNVSINNCLFCNTSSNTFKQYVQMCA